MSKFIKDFIKVYKEDRINILSGYASFFITISAVPFIALIFYVLGKLSPSLVDSFENLISTIVPQGLLNGFKTIIEQIKIANAKILLPISIITALWASCKGTGGLTRGIEHVYNSDKQYTFFANIFTNMYRTLIFTILVVISLIVFSVGRVLVANIQTDSYAMNILFQILLKLRFVAYLAFLVLVFDILYRRLSGVKGLLNHLPGAIFTSIGWTGFTAIYSIYISYVLGKPSIYLGMGTLVFFMLWIYFLVIIALIGSEINKLYIQSK